MIDDLLDTWRIHTRIILFVLDAIPMVAFESPSPKSGRSFNQMFAHIHNVRLMWLQPNEPKFSAGLSKLEKDEPLTKDRLRAALVGSGEAMGALLQDRLSIGSNIKGFKPHVPAFIGYLIAHEAYHQGEIGIALREIGHPLERKTAFGMWEWGFR